MDSDIGKGLLTPSNFLRFLKRGENQKLTPELLKRKAKRLKVQKWIFNFNKNFNIIRAYGFVHLNLKFSFRPFDTSYFLCFLKERDERSNLTSVLNNFFFIYMTLRLDRVKGRITKRSIRPKFYQHLETVHSEIRNRKMNFGLSTSSLFFFVVSWKKVKGWITKKMSRKT